MADYRDGARKVAEEARARLARLGANAGTNWRAWRAFGSGRRCDIRFALLPWDGWQVANAVAVAATIIAAAVLVLDPYLVVWYSALPDRTVGFFETLTRFGKSDWILVLTGLYVIAAFLSEAAALRARLRARRTVRTAAAAYVFCAVAVSGITASALKYLIGRARPRHFDEVGTWSLDLFSGDAGWASFPSGHATTGMALGMALALLFPRLRPAFLCAGLWIAFSRLATEEHYPSDVIAGCLLGALTAWLMARFLARRRLVFGFDAMGRLLRRRGASGRLF